MIFNSVHVWFLASFFQICHLFISQRLAARYFLHLGGKVKDFET